MPRRGRPPKYNTKEERTEARRETQRRYYLARRQGTTPSIAGSEEAGILASHLSHLTSMPLVQQLPRSHRSSDHQPLATTDKSEENANLVHESQVASPDPPIALSSNNPGGSIAPHLPPIGIGTLPSVNPMLVRFLTESPPPTIPVPGIDLSLEPDELEAIIPFQEGFSSPARSIGTVPSPVNLPAESHSSVSPVVRPQPESSNSSTVPLPNTYTISSGDEQQPRGETLPAPPISIASSLSSLYLPSTQSESSDSQIYDQLSSSEASVIQLGSENCYLFFGDKEQEDSLD
ncbi:hypothetical protein HOY80DRAFT_1048189 [Tuber brumale]|nr:hypothetical protein HOY80DRAFT_1048189 [Tuber brumale]